MSAYRQKVLRDFWQERTRSILVVLAIAIGLTAFFAVLSSYAILTRELDRGYLETNPASATLRTDRVDDELVEAVAAREDVDAAEARRSLSGRIKAGPVEWRNLVLFVVKDFGDIRVSRLQPQQGAWPARTGEMLIERDAVQVAKARIGNPVTIKTASGRERTLLFSGSVKDVGQAQARMENAVYGYINVETLALLEEEPYLDQLKIVVSGDKWNETRVRGIAGDVQKMIESRGHPVRRVDVPEPGKHPHSSIMGLLLLSMSSFGFFALILSGVLVLNLVTGLVAAQIRQIGVMKAVGGTRAQVAGIYLAQAALLGVSGLLVALPAGTWAGRALCRYAAVFLNFDIDSFAVPAWVYLLAVAVALVVPVLAAAWPVWKTSGVSVREATTHFGATGNAFGATAFDRVLARFGGTARPILLALRNSFRRRARLVSTVITLSTAGLFFMAALSVRSSLIHTLDRMFDTLGYDLTVNLAAVYPLEKLERAARRTPGVLRVEGWVTAEGSLPPSGGATGANDGAGHATAGAGEMRIGVIGIPAGTDLLRPDFAAGRALQSGDTSAVVVNSRLAAAVPQARVGQELLLQIGSETASWRVTGIVREPFAGPAVYVPRAFFERAHPGMANSLRLRLERADTDTMNAVKIALERHLEEESVRALGSASKADRRFAYDQHMVMIYVFLVVMAVILGIVGGLGLTTTMTLNVLERRREMGVLRAIGATPRAVWLIVVAEGLVIAALSWIVALAAARPFSKMVGNWLVGLLLRLSLDFSFEPSAALIWLAVCLCLGAAASFLPALRASRRPVREAIGYE